MKLVIASSLVLGSLLFAGTQENLNNESIAREYSADSSQTLDTLHSYIEWKGCKAKTAKSKQNVSCHTGTLNLSEGSITLSKQGKIIDGTAIIDMHTLTATDLSGSFKKMLETHLKGEDFFEIEKHPTIAVQIKEVTTSTIEIFTKVLGINFKHSIPYTLSKVGHKTVIDSDCSLSFEGLPTKGFQAVGSKEISPLFYFKIHLEFIS